jgi:Pyruvate/2-oxoacid:ferredoxin oxidoreductase gamma subunit
MADILILLHRDNLIQQCHYLRPGGALIINSSSAPENIESFWMDADAAACEIDQQRSVNLILIGFAISVLNDSGRAMFCRTDDIRTVLGRKLTGHDKLLAASISAFDYGVRYGERKING